MTRTQKGGPVYWLPFLFVIVIGGLLLVIFVVADIPVLDTLTSESLEIENQISYTVSAASGMQLFHTLMYSGADNTTTHEQIRQYLMCEGRPQYRCPSYPDEETIIQQINSQIDGLLTVDGLGSGKYFFEVRRNGEDMFNTSKGVATTLPESQIETVLGEQHTTVTFPVNMPDSGNASVLFMTDIGTNTVTVRAGQ